MLREALRHCQGEQSVEVGGQKSEVRDQKLVVGAQTLNSLMNYRALI